MTRPNLQHQFHNQVVVGIEVHPTTYYRRQDRRKAQRESKSEVTNDLADEVREDANVSSEGEEDDVALAMIDESHHYEVESEVESLEPTEKCPNQAETSSDVVDELETPTDLSKQLEAIIEESKREREKWSKVTEIDEKG